MPKSCQRWDIKKEKPQAPYYVVLGAQLSRESRNRAARHQSCPLEQQANTEGVKPLVTAAGGRRLTRNAAPSYFPHGKAYSWRVRQVCTCRGHLTAEGALTQRLRSWTSLGWRTASGGRASGGEVEGTGLEWGKVSVRTSPPSHEELSARLKTKTTAPGLTQMTGNEGIRARNVDTWGGPGSLTATPFRDCIAKAGPGVWCGRSTATPRPVR